MFGYTRRRGDRPAHRADHSRRPVGRRGRRAGADPRAASGVEHFETVRRRKDGALIDISLTVSPIRDACRRQVIGASKIARDITRGEGAAAGGGRAIEPREGRVPRDALARAAHAAEHPARLHADDAGRGARSGGLDQSPGRDGAQRQALSRLVNDVLDASRIVTGQMRLQLGRSTSPRCWRRRSRQSGPRRWRKGCSSTFRSERGPDGERGRRSAAAGHSGTCCRTRSKFTPSGTVDGPGLAPGGGTSESTSRIRGLEYRRGRCRGCSSGSGRPIPPTRATRAASGWGCRWCAISSSCTAATSPRTARGPAAARASRSRCRCGPLNSGRPPGRPLSGVLCLGGLRLLADREPADHRVRVVADANAGDAVSRIQLAGAGDVRFRARSRPTCR